MNVELGSKDIALFNMLLAKELSDIRVEIRHSENLEYKNCLKDREQQLNSLIELFSKIPVPDLESKC
jgi:hypothetical protein